MEDRPVLLEITEGLEFVDVPGYVADPTRPGRGATR